MQYHAESRSQRQHNESQSGLGPHDKMEARHVIADIKNMNAIVSARV